MPSLTLSVTGFQEAQDALTDLRQVQIQLEREQVARQQAEQNQTYLVKENAGVLS